jgi:4-methyl-5(b-hydroxyethyl)-thiazole monophosphate biosynthesis
MRVLMPLADGAEEMEAVILSDVLRRAGWDVTMAGLGEGPVRGSRGVRIVPDTSWRAVPPLDYDLLVLPGGGAGTEALCRDPSVLRAVREFLSSGRRVAAVCAAPLVLQAAGVLEGRRATCHPAVADRLTATARIDERVVEDGRLTTSQGPGSCFELALSLIRQVEGAAAADRVAAGLVLP